MSTEPNYRRTKPGMKASVPNSNGAAGPTSQIPGLSQSADTAPVEKSRGRRVGIQATDSDYVKLAKQGGHKGLLSHDAEDANTTKPMTSQASDSSSGDDQSQSKVSTQKLVAPFGTDDCASAWDDDAGINKVKQSTAASVPPCHCVSSALDWKRSHALLSFPRMMSEQVSTVAPEEESE
ncbi:hypothetical protein PDJAM_G00113810 [Pangasius djambal]|uniref:Uncharacterized protein n=1 Tax=Pangasius djambal TaxID=1691987 RepID=A0ACC5Y353_9TELE|nr:hypothetical protein [Pangasius djambal]